MPVRPAANTRPAAILLAMKNFLLIIKLLDLNRQTAGSLREPGGLPDWIKHQKIRWAIGVIISVFSLAKLMEYVLAHHPVQTWAFFFGLIVVSAVFLLYDIKDRKGSDVIWLVLGGRRVIKKNMMSPTETTSDLWFIAVCGAIAICTMILPGISGSFILVLFGKYEYIMKAVSELNIPVLLVFALGCVIGIVAFSKFLHWLIGKYEKQTLLVLIGFTIGALVKVWPWADKAAYEAANLLNGQPSGALHIGGAVAWALIGAGMVLAMELLTRKKNS